MIQLNICIYLRAFTGIQNYCTYNEKNLPDKDGSDVSQSTLKLKRKNIQLV